MDEDLLIEDGNLEDRVARLERNTEKVFPPCKSMQSLRAVGLICVLALLFIAGVMHGRSMVEKEMTE